MVVAALVVLVVACAGPSGPGGGGRATGDDGDWPDADGDGYVSCADCDDTDAQVHPDAVEVCGNGVDDDCDSRAPGCGLAGYMTTHDAGAKVHGTTTIELGTYVGAPGDVTGDGYADLLVGDSAGRRSWLLEGPLSGKVELDEAVARVGARGASVMAPARNGFDFDGDGVHDVGVGGQGPLYLWYGPVRGDLDPATADIVMDANGSTLVATTDVTSLGDIDGDGRDDLFINDPAGWICQSGSDDCGKGGGVGYLVPGQSSSEIELSEASLVVVGTAASNLRHGAVGPGDLDGDGIDDLAIPVDGGAVQVVFGPLLDAGLITAGDVELVNSRSATAGRLSAVGDVDGDGTAELGVAFAEMGPKSVAMVLAVPDRGAHSVDDIALFRAYTLDGGVDQTTCLDADDDGVRDLAIGGQHVGLGAHDRGWAAVFHGPLSGTVSYQDAEAYI